MENNKTTMPPNSKSSNPGPGQPDLDEELNEAELDEISGGTNGQSNGSKSTKAGHGTISPFIFTKHYDKSSPILL